MATTALISAEEFAEMSFDHPVELVRGEIVEMTRPGGIHGVVCFRCASILDRWHPSGDVFQVVSNDTGVVTSHGPDSVRGPDLFVVRRDRLPDGRIPAGNFGVAPDVCIEVKSPHERWSAVIHKVSEYLGIGVSEVWVVDPDRRRVHVYHLDTEPDVLNCGDTLISSALPEFHCAVDEFFRGL